jgi:hypothetical protein
MRKFRVLLAAILVLPLVAFGSSLGSSDTVLASVNSPGFTPADADGAEAYTCCFIYIMGRWWCVPC